MVDFSQLKKNSGRAALEKLASEVKKMDDKTDNTDNRFWYPAVDKAGNGFAIIRFLPAPAGDDTDFVRVFEHGFKGPTGQWYIEKSLSTIGKPDPLMEYNSMLWNASDDDASPTRKQARDQKRKLVYITNVYVIQDDANPENQGKVFLFKVGKKIWDKLKDAMKPQYADETPMNPFDLWEGANFKLKIRKLDGYRNYDKSEFSKPAPLFDDDKKMEAVWKQEYSLKEFIDPATFKTYEELEKRLHVVLGTNQKPTTSAAKSYDPKSVYGEPLNDEIPSFDNDGPPNRRAEEPKQVAATEDEDDDLNFFRNLAKKN